MNQYSYEYPIKIVSRAAAISKVRKLRLYWVVAGVAFSIGCTSSLTPIFGTDVSVAATDIPSNISASNHKDVLLEDIIGAAPDEITTQASIAQASIAQPPIGNSPSQETLATIETPANEAEIAYPKNMKLEVKKGDTLISLLNYYNIPIDEAQKASDSLKKMFDHRRLDVGSVVSVQTDKDKKGNIIVSELSLPDSKFSTIKLSRKNNGEFNVTKTNVPLTRKLARAGGVINSSIYQTGSDTGIPSAMLSELINAYSYDVDFQRDIKKGDSIDVLFERMETEDGVVAGNGNFVFSELNLGDRVLKIYRYSDKYGNSDFYNEKGESVRKSLLRTPINGAKVTSSFGMRQHPIMGYSKMHKGVDFGAPTGTPIYAAGDGVVKVASVKGGYGKYLKIEHTDKYESAYAHLSRYASGIAPGKRVKQGQIVGYVGSTGASTGPHLHYEILANGQQVNPANVKFKTGNILKGKELASFKSKLNKLEARLASIDRGKTVAMVDEQTTQSKTTN